MAQHDYNIANQLFGQFRLDVNNALLAIASNNSGPTAPAVTIAGMYWFDTTNQIIKLRNANNTAWVNIFDVANASAFAPGPQGPAGPTGPQGPTGPAPDTSTFMQKTGGTFSGGVTFGTSGLTSNGTVTVANGASLIINSPGVVRTSGLYFNETANDTGIVSGGDGIVAIINNNTHRWSFGPTGDLVTITDGHVYCAAPLKSQGNGYAMVSAQTRFGHFNWDDGNQWITFTIDGAGRGINVFASDAEVKEDATPTTTEILPLLRKVQFHDWRYKPLPGDKEKGKKKKLNKAGVLAQNVKVHLPWWVAEVNGTLMLDAQNILTGLMKAIVELDARVPR